MILSLNHFFSCGIYNISLNFAVNETDCGKAGVESYESLNIVQNVGPLNLITVFRYVAIFEGISYLSLGVTMPLKHVANMPTPNYVVGMTHGVLFILYISLLILCWNKYRWTFSRVFLLFVASLVPFGTFIADAKILKPVEKARV